MKDAVVILPGRIIKFYEATQTADILICAESVIQTADNTSQLSKRKPIMGVPCQTPSGGGWSMTCPIEAGNTCILMFSQVGYDHWLYQDRDEAGTLANLPKPWLSRSFSKDDGMAICGLNTLPQAIDNFTLDGSQWRNANAIQNIHLKRDLSIEINSPTTVTINAPSVIVNTQTATVNASSKVDLNTPDTNISGKLTVEGLVTCNAGMELTGGALLDTIDVATVTATSGVSIGGIEFDAHVHEYDGGTATTDVAK